MLQELFIDVLKNYRQESKTPLAGNKLAQVLRQEFPENFRWSASISDAYKVDGSPGKGNWSEVPWIGIFDKQITTTAESGYYIVYLFDANMNGVYLSLNQGYDQFEQAYKVKGARVELQKSSARCQKILKSVLGEFSFEPINLHAKNNLGKGYTLGHICGKFYEAGHIPRDSIIVDDLRNLIGVYRELKGIVGGNIMDLSMELLAESEEKIETPFSSKVKVSELKLDKIDTTQEEKYISKKPMIFDEERSLEKQRRNKKIGDSAEKLVKEIEQDRLQQNGRSDLAEKVKIVSEDMNLGYDIESFEEDETPKHIEVKGTTSRTLCAFFLSQNEFEKSKVVPNYYLYRVYGVGSDDAEVRFLRSPNFSSDNFKMRIRQYHVKYTPKSFE